MKKIKITLTALILTLSMGLLINAAPREESKTDQAREQYKEARKAMHRKNWQKAIHDLNRLIKDYSSSAYTDDSFYWLGYSLNQMSRSRDNNNRSLSLKIEALSQIEILLNKFPKSKWLDDARILRIEIAENLVKSGLKEYKKYILKGASGEIDNSLKIAALDSLLEMDSEKAFPLLEKILKKPGDAKTRNRAIYVLGQSENPRGIPLLLEIARKETDPKTRDNAIFWLGQYEAPEAREGLISLYKTSGDPEIKLKVLYAFTQDDKPESIKKIITLFHQEQDTNIKKKIIFILGRSHSVEAQEFLEKILLED